MRPKIVVIDLDGTLLDTNTFHKWLLFLFKKSLIKNPIDSVKIVSTILWRLSKKISHKEMKYKILKISEKSYYQGYLIEFVESISKYLNKNVFNYLQDKNSIYILATAAPDLYASHIAKKYNFDHCIATPSTDIEPWDENIRIEKQKNLKLLLESLKVEKANIVITDHHDDIPILALGIERLLVNPSQLSEEKIKENNIDYNIL